VPIENRLDVSELLRYLGASRWEDRFLDLASFAIPVLQVGDASHLTSPILAPSSLFGSAYAAGGGAGLHDSWEVRANPPGGCLVKLYRHSATQVFFWQILAAASCAAGSQLTGQIAGPTASVCEVWTDQIADSFTTTDDPAFFVGNQMEMGTFYVPTGSYLLLQAENANTPLSLTLHVKDIPVPVP
jgi:hypothetical protein